MLILFITGAYRRNRDKSVVLRSFACMSCVLASWNGHNFCPNCGADTILAAIFSRKFGALNKHRLIRGIGEADSSGGQKSKFALGSQTIFLWKLGTQKLSLDIKPAEFEFLLTNTVEIILKMLIHFFSNSILNVIAPSEGGIYLTKSG